MRGGRQAASRRVVLRWMISIKSRRSTTHRLLRPGRCQNGSGESRLRRGYHGRSDSESKFSVGSQHQSGAAVAGLPVRSMLSYHADSLGHSKPRNEDLGGQHGRRGRVRDHRALRPLHCITYGKWTHLGCQIGEMAAPGLLMEPELEALTVPDGRWLCPNCARFRDPHHTADLG